MEDEAIDEKDDLESSPSSHKQELISIRKKLADPNCILPGPMHRSHHPIHLLTVQPDFDSTSALQMPLAEQLQSLQSDDTCKNQPSVNNQCVPKGQKQRYLSELMLGKGPQRLKNPQVIRQIYQKCLKRDPLQWLKGNIRNVLQNPSQILFITKTALLSNLKGNFQRLKNLNMKTENNQFLVKYLQNMSFFAAIPYACDLHQSADLVQDLPAFEAPEDLLSFADDFESSNLFLATKTKESLLKESREGQSLAGLYFLAVRLDYNTLCYGQWFYFKVSRKQTSYSFNRSEGNLFKFMIINMTKSSSMFGKGLKVSVCRKGVWRKEGINIRYYQNSIIRPQPLDNHTKQSHYYTLQFTLQIYQEEQIYIAYNQPYTFSRMGKLLDSITTKYEHNNRNILKIKRHTITTTHLHNPIEVINFSVQNSEEAKEEKKVIFITGRCHPIETAGSHVLEGILNTLSSLFVESPIQQQKNHILYKLLQNYIIKIIPMINPDGVILGNSRCNLAGYDLNRAWKTAKRQNCRQVYALKKFILQHQNRIAMFIDLHAHSKKKNVFAYGCHDISNPFATREFPFLLSKLSQHDFLFSECRFTRLKPGPSNQKGGKDGTARVFLYHFLRIPNVFTIENSYCSAKDSIFHYDRSSYELIGGDILKAISLYFSPNFRINPDWFSDQPLKVSKTLRKSDDSRQQVSQNSLQMSVDTSKMVNFQVGKNGDRVANAIDLRQQFIKELRINKDNISVGLMKDEASESEEEERIYEVSHRNKKSPTENTSSHKKTKRGSKTDKVLTYLQKSKTYETTKKGKDQQHSNKRSLLNVSSSHSERNLTVNKTKTNKFYTISKPIESIYLPFTEERAQTPVKILQPRRKKAKLSDVEHKKDKCLSIVEIGLTGKSQITHNYRLNIMHKMEQRALTQHIQRSELIRQRQIKTQIEPQLLRKREEEVKEYIRRLVRPRQIIERRQNMGMRNQKQEMHLKQSNIEFSESRLSQLCHSKPGSKR